MHIDERGLYTQYGMWHTPFWQKPWFVYGVYGFLLLLCIVISLCIVRWYRTRVQKNIPYWKVYLKQLEALKNKNIQEDQAIEFYTNLIAIYKGYMSALYSVNLYCKTDEECIIACETLPVTVEQKEEIRTLFAESVEVRFAHRIVSCERMKRDLNNCISYITQTRPHEKQSRT